MGGDQQATGPHLFSQGTQFEPCRNLCLLDLALQYTQGHNSTVTTQVTTCNVPTTRNRSTTAAGVVASCRDSVPGYPCATNPPDSTTHHLVCSACTPSQGCGEGTSHKEGAPHKPCVQSADLTRCAFTLTFGDMCECPALVLALVPEGTLPVTGVFLAPTPEYQRYGVLLNGCSIMWNFVSVYVGRGRGGVGRASSWPVTAYPRGFAGVGRPLSVYVTACDAAVWQRWAGLCCASPGPAC